MIYKFRSCFVRNNRINDSDLLISSSYSRILINKIILSTNIIFFFDLSYLIINIFSHEDDIFITFFLASALSLTDSDIRSDESKIFLLSSLKNLMKNLMKNLISKIELWLIISLFSVFSVSRSSLKLMLSETITESDFLLYNQ